MNDFSLAFLQLSSVDNYKKNISEILSSLENISPTVKALFLPENSLYMRTDFSKKVEPIAEDSSMWESFKELVVEKNIWIHFGGVPLKTQKGIENASLVMDPKGNLAHTYSKIHLFDIELSGKTAYKESDTFVAGSEPKCIDILGWKIGQSICYDLRFSELYYYYALQKVDMIIVPSAFLVKTGKAHWETLLKARAIENQCYVLAPAQSGGHSKHQSYGHSLLIDPWGEVLIEGDGGTGTQYFEATISKSKVQEIREQMPMSQHRVLTDY